MSYQWLTGVSTTAILIHWFSITKDLVFITRNTGQNLLCICFNSYISTSGPTTAAKRSKCSANIQLLKIHRSAKSELAWSPLHVAPNRLNPASFSTIAQRRMHVFQRAGCPHSTHLQVLQPRLHQNTSTGHGVPPAVRPDRLQMPFWNAFGLAAPLSCSRVPLKMCLTQQPPTFMPAQSVSPWAVLHPSFRFLCRSWNSSATSVPRNHKPHVYTAAALTWYHGTGVPTQHLCAPPAALNWRLLVRNFPLLCQPPYLFPDCLSPLPPYSLALPIPSCFSLQGPFLWKRHNFPLGEISKQGLAVVPGIPQHGAVGGEKK